MDLRPTWTSLGLTQSMEPSSSFRWDSKLERPTDRVDHHWCSAPVSHLLASQDGGAPSGSSSGERQLFLRCLTLTLLIEEGEEQLGSPKAWWIFRGYLHCTVVGFGWLRHHRKAAAAELWVHRMSSE